MNTLLATILQICALHGLPNSDCKEYYYTCISEYTESQQLSKLQAINVCILELPEKEMRK